MSVYVKQISLWSNTHQYTYTHRHTFRLMVKYGCWFLCFSLHFSVLVTLLKGHVLFAINNYWIISTNCLKFSWQFILWDEDLEKKEYRTQHLLIYWKSAFKINIKRSIVLYCYIWARYNLKMKLRGQFQS